MIHFETAKKAFDIGSEEEFHNSEMSGVEKLLNTRYTELLFCQTKEENEEVIELYYFLEANSETLVIEDNFQMVRIDGVNFVIIDDNGEYTIVLHKKDKQFAEELI